MERAKALLTVDGLTLLGHHARTLASWADRLIVVIGADAARLQEHLPPGALWVHNADWASTWPADSLRLALETFDVTGSCWVAPVDIPPMSDATLAALAHAGPPAVPIDLEGRPGHPVLLDEATVAAVRHQAPEGGLRTLLEAAPRIPVSDPEVATDLNTPEAWDAWRERKAQAD